MLFLFSPGVHQLQVPGSDFVVVISDTVDDVVDVVDVVVVDEVDPDFRLVEVL